MFAVVLIFFSGKSNVHIEVNRFVLLQINTIVAQAPIKALDFPLVQMSAKRYLVETENDGETMDTDEYGYGDQNRDEYAFEEASKRRRGKFFNKSPPSPPPPPENHTPW